MSLDWNDSLFWIVLPWVIAAIYNAGHAKGRTYDRRIADAQRQDDAEIHAILRRYANGKD